MALAFLGCRAPGLEVQGIGACKASTPFYEKFIVPLK